MNAWTTQPLMTTAIIFATLFVVYSWVFVLFRLPRLRLEGSTKGPALLLAVLLVVATAASWVYLLVQAR